mgnify:CR=1 FL=1|nr:hypothetical protein [uncultured Dongia sp.]
MIDAVINATINIFAAIGAAVVFIIFVLVVIWCSDRNPKEY